MQQILLDRPSAVKPAGKLTFSTRQRFARVMLDRLDLHPDDHLLDPSAGSAALVMPLLSGRYPVPKTTVLVDIDPRCCDMMERRLDGYDMPFLVTRGDFLEMTGHYAPTAIVMVPPRGGGQDIVHIEHAYRILRPGGRMVAVCSTEAMTGSDARSLSFKLFLAAVNAEFEPVPSASFDDPTVDGFLLCITK